MPAVTDLKDVRVHIPRVRRALDGPHATGSAATSNTLSDEEVTNAVADAIAEVILFAPGAFGKSLEVTERDSYYMAPVAWQTSEELSEGEAAVVAIQAALNYFHYSLATMKTSEEILDEGRSWSWTISAQAVSERMKALRADRDKALEALMGTEGVEEWVNTLYVRDRQTDVLIEPWFSGYGGQEMDPRFGGPM